MAIFSCAYASNYMWIHWELSSQVINNDVYNQPVVVVFKVSPVAGADAELPSCSPEAGLLTLPTLRDAPSGVVEAEVEALSFSPPAKPNL